MGVDKHVGGGMMVYKCMDCGRNNNIRYVHPCEGCGSDNVELKPLIVDDLSPLIHLEPLSMDGGFDFHYKNAE